MRNLLIDRKKQKPSSLFKKKMFREAVAALDAKLKEERKRGDDQAELMRIAIKKCRVNFQVKKIITKCGYS
jgi:hypothetical protein